MTKFTIPTHYRAKYKFEGKRSEHETFLRGAVEVDINEVADAAAPVIHSIRDECSKPSDYRPFSTSDGSECLVRKFDGKLYAKRWRAQELVDDAMETRGNRDVFKGPFCGEYRDDEGAVLIGLAKRTVVSSRADVEESAGRAIRKWDDEFLRTKNAIEDRVSEMILVDGWVYELVGEPVIAIRFDGYASVFRLVMDEDRRPESRYTSIYTESMDKRYPRFGVDELERARSVGSNLAREQERPLVEGIDIRTAAPWEITFRGETEAMLKAANAVADFGMRHLSNLNANFGLAWHDLVSAMYAKGVITPPLVGAMQRMNSMIREGIFCTTAPNEVRTYSQLADAVARTISFAVDLWNSRSDRGFEWIDEALDISSTHWKDAFAYEVCTLNAAFEVARAIGISANTIDNLAAEAAAGRGHLIAVHDIRGPLSMIFVVDRENGPEIVETHTRHGGRSSTAAVVLAMSHIRSGKRSKADMTIDLELCGI